MEQLTMEEIDKIRDDMMDKRLGVLYKHTLGYLSSMFNIELNENYMFIYLNRDMIKIQFQRLIIHDYFNALIEFSLSGSLGSVTIKCSTKSGDKTVYHKYTDKILQNKIDLIEDENIKQITQYFINHEDLIKFVMKKYNRLYKTQYYNNLQSVTTFLLICKFLKFLPKDIYLIIAKKILFFLKLKKRKRERNEVTRG